MTRTMTSLIWCNVKWWVFTKIELILNVGLILSRDWCNMLLYSLKWILDILFHQINFKLLIRLILRSKFVKHPQFIFVSMVCTSSNSFCRMKLEYKSVDASSLNLSDSLFDLDSDVSFIVIQRKIELNWSEWKRYLLKTILQLKSWNAWNWSDVSSKTCPLSE